MLSMCMVCWLKSWDYLQELRARAHLCNKKFQRPHDDTHVGHLPANALVSPRLTKSVLIKSLSVSWRFFNSVASCLKISSIFVLSLADTSITVMISGIISQRSTASEKSTSLNVSWSHLLPYKKILPLY